jgi:hypothetical protein
MSVPLHPRAEMQSIERVDRQAVIPASGVAYLTA